MALSPVQNTPFTMAAPMPQTSPLNQKLTEAAADGVISKQEFKDLESLIKNSDLSPAEQKDLTKLLDKAKDYTNRSFLGLWSDGKVSPKEMERLRELVAKSCSPGLQDLFMDAFEQGVADNANVRTRPTYEYESQDLSFPESCPPDSRPGTIPANEDPLMEGPAQSSGIAAGPAAFAGGQPSGLQFPTPSKHSTQSEETPIQVAANGDLRGLGGGNATSKYASSINSWFVPQYINPKDPASSSNCGPASVLMMLKANGLGQGLDLPKLRKLMSAPRTGAVDSAAIARGIRNASGGKLKAEITEGTAYKGNPKAFLDKIRADLKAGKLVTLLTQNMSTHKNGHYMVVQGVKPDGSLIVADPGSSASGKNRVFSYADFELSYRNREKSGMPNNLISVSPN